MVALKKYKGIFFVVFFLFIKSALACFTIDGFTNDWPVNALHNTDSIGDNPHNIAEDIIDTLIYDEVDIHGETNLYIAMIFRDQPTNGSEIQHFLYIDVDNNSNTGAPKDDGPYWSSDSFGADYLLEFFTSYTQGFYNINMSGPVEYWDSGSAQWTPGVIIWNIAYHSNIIELEIPFSVLTNSGSDMSFAFCSTISTNMTNVNQADCNNDSGSSNIVYTKNYGVCPDNESPQLVYSDPADGAVFVSIDQDIVIRLDDNAFVRSNTISVVVDGSNAIVNGVFQNGFTGTITPFNTWGWEVLINPNSDFPPNTTINVDVNVQDRGYNILNTTFSFMSAYGVIIPPPPPPPGISPLKQGQYYWGWVPDMEGGKNELHNAPGVPERVMSDFDVFVIPEWETLENEDRNYYANAIPTMRSLNPDMIILAGVDVSIQSYGTSTNHANSAIAKFNPDGIMWANLTGVNRSYQNKCWDFVAGKDLIGGCSGGNGNPASVFSNSGTPTTAPPGSIFIDFNFMITNGNFYADYYSREIHEALQLYNYKKTLGIRAMVLSQEAQGSKWGDYDTAASLNRQDFGYMNALLYGADIFSACGWELCAPLSTEYLYWYPESRMPYIGTMYLSEPKSNTSSGNWERITDTGVIWVDYSSDSAGFSPYGIYYVDISIGNNAATPAQAQNPATPWKTIGHAISNVNAGSIIKVEPTGSYNETMTIINGGGGFWNLPITIEGDGAKPDVQGSFVFNAQLVTIKNLNITTTGSNVIQLLSTASNIVIEDCILHDSSYSAVRCDGHRNYIENNIISNSTYGILISGSGAYNNNIFNNTIYKTTTAAIYVRNSSKSNTISFNNIYNNHHGIYLNNSDYDGIMLNHIYDNSNNGIFVRNSQNVLVKNNTCVNNNYGINLTGTDTGTTVINNITMSNAIGYRSTAGAWNVTYSCSYNDTSAVNNFNGGTFTSGTGCVTVDPVFSSVSTRDLRLGINTSLLNAGEPQQTTGAIGGTGVSVIPTDSSPSVLTSHTITFTTPYPNGIIPKDGKIVLVYPPGFDVSSVSVSSGTIDGGFLVSVYSNQITIARDSSGTATNPGETYSLVINNIRNTTAIGLNTLYWKVTDLYDQNLFGPQISNDINIGDPFTVLLTTPNNGAMGYPLTNDIKVVFSQDVKISTINVANLKIYDDSSNLISGSVVAQSNVAIFTPDNSLFPNEWYFGVVTTGVQNTNNVALYKNYFWKFKTEPSTTTPHEYNTIVYDGNPGEWNVANIVTYDSSNRENLAIESNDDTGADQTEEFWGTWNTNVLSFLIRKDNTGGSTGNWYDYIAIDVTKDDKGASTFHSAFATYTFDFAFSNYRKPEFIIMLDHNSGGQNWNGAELAKWTGTQWTNLGSSHIHWQGSGVNDSEYIECGIDINILSNSAVNALDPIPNRIAVQTFEHHNNTTYDYCPESPTWLNMDIDNDNNNIPDFVIPYGGPLYVSAQDGDDGNRGTISEPLQTIGEAFNRFDTNPKITNTIAYCRGEFVGQYTFQSSGGTFSHPYVLDAWTNEIGKLPVLNANGANYGFYFNCTTAKSNIQIKHWVVTNFSSRGIYIYNNGAEFHNIDIIGCRISSSSGQGINFRNAGYGLAVSNVIYNGLASPAIYYYGGAYPDGPIYRNYIYNVGSFGIRCDSTVNGITVRNNTIVGTGNHGIRLDGTGNHIHNNILMNITGDGTHTAANNDSCYNCFTNISGDNDDGPTNTNPHSVLVSPQFLSLDPSSTDFLHIDSTSPCFDAGNPIYDGYPETRFAHIDIGAYESTNNAFAMLRIVTSKTLISAYYGNQKVPGSKLRVKVKYDNDSTVAAQNSSILVLLSTNVTYVSNSASQNNNIHTGAGGVTIEVFNGSSWIADAGNYNPILVRKIRWKFINPVGSNDNSEGTDSLNSADGEFPDSDAGIVKYDVIIK